MKNMNFSAKLDKRRIKSPLSFPLFSLIFVLSSDHLPKLLQGLYKPEYLQTDYSDLLKLAESHLNDEVTPAMVDHLAQLTFKQSMSREWFKYRAGRISASKFRQVLDTDPHQPSLSLLKSIVIRNYNVLAPKLPHGAVNMKRMLSQQRRLVMIFN